MISLQIENVTSTFECVTTIGYGQASRSRSARLYQEQDRLNDRLINAGKILLKEQFPDMGGLQNIDLAERSVFKF